MKIVVLICATLFTVQSFAQGTEVNDITVRKTEVLKEIDERIAKLNEHKACVNAAADKDGMKKCHEAMKEYRHSERDERKERRKERKEKRATKE